MVFEVAGFEHSGVGVSSGYVSGVDLQVQPAGKQRGGVEVTEHKPKGSKGLL